MKTASYPHAAGTQVINRSGDGIRASFTGGRSLAAFNLGLDISALRPRQRFVVRALLQRMSRKPVSAQPAPQF